MTVNELIERLEELPPDMEVFERWSEDESQILSFDVTPEVHMLYRKGDDVGFEEQRNSDYMNRYRLDDLKDAVVFKGVVL